MSGQLSAISHQLSAISYQLSAISHQLSAYELWASYTEQLLNKTGKHSFNLYYGKLTADH